MCRKLVLHTAALIGVGLLTSSLSFAQPSVATTKTYSAIVGATDLLRVGPEGSSSTHIATGVYQVDFPTDVWACVYTATIGTSPATTQIGPAIVTVTPRAGIPEGIYVETFSFNGTPADNPCNIQVQCQSGSYRRQQNNGRSHRRMSRVPTKPDAACCRACQNAKRGLTSAAERDNLTHLPRGCHFVCNGGEKMHGAAQRFPFDRVMAK